MKLPNTPKLSEEALKEWTKFIGFAFIFLSILGLVKSFIFYKLLGINIMYYIDLQELALIAFQDLSGTITFFIICIFVSFSFFPIKKIKEYSKLSFKNRLISSTTTSIYVCLIYASVTLFVIPIFYDGLYIYESYLIIHSRFYSICLFWSVVVIYFGSVYFVYETICIEILILISNYINDPFRTYHTFATFCCFTIYVETIIILIDYSHINDNLNKGSTFKTEKITYVVDDSNILVGRTKAYVFIKNNKKNNIVVIPVVQIIEETIKENEWKHVKVSK